MLVADIMTQETRSCSLAGSLNDATRLMWEGDLGAVPVVDEAGRAIGMLTDRDVAMAAYLQGQPIGAIPIGSAMSREVHTCKASDTLGAAREMMMVHKLHRLPVVDDGGVLIGIVTLNDLSLAALHAAKKRKKGAVTSAQVGEAVAAIFAGDPLPMAASG